jgi:thiol:disulfide interchange protein
VHRTLFILLGLALAAPALGAALPSVVTVQISAEPSVVPPGGEFALSATLTIQSGWHIYGLEAGTGPTSTAIRVASPEGFGAVGAVEGPAPEVKFDTGFQRDVPTYHGQVTFRLPVRVAESVAEGPHTLSVEVAYQPCTETMCLRPTHQRVEVPVEVNASAPGSYPLSPIPYPPSEGVSATQILQGANLESILDQGLFAFLVWAGVWGFFSLLTPCVFPMIPITVSLFAKRSEKGEGSALGAALVYAASIVFTYTVLGLLLAAAWGASGARRLSADPWVNLGLTVLFVALALSLFGLFELRMPGWLMNWAGRGQSRGGLAGVLFMGVAFTLTSFTCTVAFVGLLFGQAAEGQWFWPGIGMAVYSVCFASPFFLLALFPQFLRRLPAAGQWMNTTKVLMGFLELAAAMKFISNADLIWNWEIFRNAVVLGSWAVIALFMTLHLLRVFRLPHDGPVQSISVGRMFLGMGTAALTLVFLVGLFVGKLPVWVSTYLPEVKENLEWIDNLDDGLKVAQATGRPIFVDFTGWTCTNCRQMEIEVFPAPEVQNLLERYVRVRLYTDDAVVGERWARLQEDRFATAALPFYVLLTPQNQVIDTRAGIVRPASAFAEFLRAGLARAG